MESINKFVDSNAGPTPDGQWTHHQTTVFRLFRSAREKQSRWSVEVCIDHFKIHFETAPTMMNLKQMLRSRKCLNVRVS